MPLSHLWVSYGSFILGGSGVSIPMSRTYNKLKDDMEKKIEDGIYLTGDRIVPKTKTKLKVSDETISEKSFTIEGRRIDMKKIRERIYHQHLQMGILRTESSEINRFLILWADHACILNSGYLLLTVKVLYENNTFLSDKEMLDKFGRNCDVQQLVESPHIYILAPANDSIAEKLSFVGTRLEDINQLKQPLYINNKQINDVMRFFHGKSIIHYFTRWLIK